MTENILLITKDIVKNKRSRSGRNYSMRLLILLTSHHKGFGEFFSILLALSIVIMLLNHFHACSGGIGRVWDWEVMVYCHGYGCMTEYVCVQVKAQSKLFTDNLQPFIKKLTEFLKGIILGRIRFLLLIVNDREYITVLWCRGRGSTLRIAPCRPSSVWGRETPWEDTLHSCRTDPYFRKSSGRVRRTG